MNEDDLTFIETPLAIPPYSQYTACSLTQFQARWRRWRFLQRKQKALIAHKEIDNII